MIIQAHGSWMAFVIRDWPRGQMKIGRDTFSDLLKQYARTTRKFHCQSLSKSITNVAITIKIATQQMREKFIRDRWERCCQTFIGGYSKRHQSIHQVIIHYGRHGAVVHVDGVIRLKNIPYLFQNGGVHA